ncbi:MAG: hypothetical protein VX604_05045 [Gemmatimonadota bacterium]|nr:hypothetical protein [Gemmatimonadota bacterium]
MACYFLLNHLIGIAVHCEELINHHFLTDAEGDESVKNFIQRRLGARAYLDWALFLEES